MGLCGLQDGSQWKCSNSAKIWSRNFWYHTKCVSGQLDPSLTWCMERLKSMFNIYKFRQWQWSMDGINLIEALVFEPDVVFGIISYLTLTEINILESSSYRFEVVLDSIRFWERRITKEFGQQRKEIEESIVPARTIYWELRYLGYWCSTNIQCYNLCNNCLEITICFNITKCDSCRH